jgi:competence protein ComFC
MDFQEIHEIWSLYQYEGPVKNILAAVKFHGKFWLLDIFNNVLEELVLALTHENHYDLIVPIPLSRPKLMHRRFNQTEIIAQHVSKITKLKMEKILHKKWHIGSQSELGREERLTHLMDAFTVSHARRIKNKNILLIDDILTTGATVREAARVLKDGGANQVSVVVLAYTSKSGASS